MIKVRVAEFTRTPGPRYKSEGSHSAEEFREKVLEPAFMQATLRGQPVSVDLDGTMGFGSGFLEEISGGMVRKFGAKSVHQFLFFSCLEEPYILDEIKRYVDESLKEALASPDPNKEGAHDSPDPRKHPLTGFACGVCKAWRLTLRREARRQKSTKGWRHCVPKSEEDPVKIAEHEMRYSVLLRWSDEDNEWVATIPEWKGLSALGKTRADAVAEIEKVIAIAVPGMKASRDAFPSPKVLQERPSGMDRE